MLALTPPPCLPPPPGSSLLTGPEGLTAKERDNLKRLKCLRRYRQRYGVEALLHRQLKERRVMATDGAAQQVCGAVPWGSQPVPMLCTPPAPRGALPAVPSLPGAEQKVGSTSLPCWLYSTWCPPREMLAFLATGA